MVEKAKEALKLQFDKRLRLEISGCRFHMWNTTYLVPRNTSNNTYSDVKEEVSIDLITQQSF